MSSFRLGKKPPIIDSRTLRFGRYLTPALPPPPPTVTLYTAIPSWPMDGNDELGDCTMAGAAHLVEAWTGEQPNGTPVEIPTTTIEEDYFALTGGPDDGLAELTVLKWWKRTGFVDAAGIAHTISAYAQVDPANQTETQQAVSIFGGAYLGLALPDYAVNPPDGNLLDVDWTAVPPGGFAANPPDPNNGHCVVAVGYDADNLYVVTWGAIKPMSYAFGQAYVDETFAIISPDWLGAGTTPSGFDLAQLETDLADVTGKKKRRHRL